MIKRTLFITIFIFGLITLFSSCEKKTELFDNNNEIKGIVENTSKSSIISFEIKAEKGLLVFKDMDSFSKTLKSLEKQVDEYDDAFINKYKSLKANELELKEKELKFNEFKPLLVFENKFNYISLRKVIQKRIDVWLNNEKLDIENDPDDYFIEDIYVRTLLNKDAEVKIGKSIYKFLEDGTYFEIINGDFITLKQAKTGIIDIYNTKNIKVTECDCNNKAGDDDCNTNKWSSGYVTATNKEHRMKWKVGIYHYPWGSGIKSKVINYKWHGGWLRKWKRERTDLYVGVNGKFCKDTLGNLTSFIGWATKSKSNKKHLSVRTSTGYHKTKTKQILGFHDANGLSKNSKLTFVSF